MRLFLICIVLISVSCASTPFICSLSPQAGRRAAQRDIAAHQMCIYVAGTRGSSEVGVEPADHDLVARLPRNHSLPVGCTIPYASEAVDFAQAYNREVVQHLRAHPST